MLLLLSAIVDKDALVKMLWTASLAGIGVTAAFGVAIVGAARAVDAGRDGRPIDAALFGLLGAFALAVVGGAIAYGIVVMIEK
jgi:hypothetical protein